MKYFLDDANKYSEIDQSLIKGKKIPVICRSGVTSEYPGDFDFVVYDQNNVLRAKCIELVYAKEYAEFLADNVS